MTQTLVISLSGWLLKGCCDPYDVAGALTQYGGIPSRGNRTCQFWVQICVLYICQMCIIL